VRKNFTLAKFRKKLCRIRHTVFVINFHKTSL
jgi:hypothetical protein